MRALSRERQRIIRTYGNLYRVSLNGGSSNMLVKGCFPYEAVQEAARRLGLEEDEILSHTVEEVKEPWYR